MSTRKIVYYIYIVNLIVVLIIFLYAWSKWSYLPGPLMDVLMILTLYQILMTVCTVLLAGWVADDGEVIAGETEDYEEGLEQRVSELEKKLEGQSKTLETGVAWRCPNCKRANSSRAKTCCKCGAKRPD